MMMTLTTIRQFLSELAKFVEVPCADRAVAMRRVSPTCRAFVITFAERRGDLVILPVKVLIDSER
jgi:hypothetical protein